VEQDVAQVSLVINKELAAKWGEIPEPQNHSTLFLDEGVPMKPVGKTGSTTLMNTDIELSIPGFLQMQYTDFAVHKQLAKGGTAVLYQGILLSEEAQQRAKTAKIAVKVLSKFFSSNKEKNKTKQKNKTEIK